jgi:hypothetical protein
LAKGALQSTLFVHQPEGNLEHSVYRCSWSQTGGRYALWVKSRPWIRCEGDSYEQAEEQLLNAILDAGGAMQAMLEFDPQLPKSSQDAKYSTPELYYIAGDDGFETDSPKRVPFESGEEREARFQWTDAFFESPVCRTCGRSRGRRTGQPLRLTHVPQRYDGAIGNIGESRNTLYIFSDRFLDLLTDDERQRLHFQPVECLRGRRRFFELVGPQGPPNVAVSGLPQRGWRCQTCSLSRWTYLIDGMYIRTFIAKADLPDSLPSVFTIGTVPDIRLVTSNERWGELSAGNGTRGILSHPLGVVKEDELIRVPEL